MADRLAETIETVRQSVIPRPGERRDLEAAVTHVLSATETVVGELAVDADVVRVGSTARDTWLRGERDIDIFVRFPPELSREQLKEYGLAVGRKVLPEGRQEYAEHPYVTGELDGYTIDLVPCFRVADGEAIKSAVDRSPFHAAYVKDRLTTELANDVRLLKHFCDAHGLYGSDLRTRGFSGYLTELLILEYGGFRGVIEAVASWSPPVELDPEAHGTKTFTDPLVVIDPTDSARNVAAVVHRETVARLQHYARELLADPDECWFEVRHPNQLTERELLEHVQRRGVEPVAIRCPSPDLVEDELYPQLRTTLAGIEGGMEQQGFEILRSTCFAGDHAVWYLELVSATLPAVERHVGPPVQLGEHARSFIDTYDEPGVYGPFIDGDRYVVERERDWRDAAAYLRSDELLSLRLGASMKNPLREDRDVLIGDEVTVLLPGGHRALSRFYDPIP